MAVREIICAFIFVSYFNLILTLEDIDEDYEIEKNARVVGRAYSLTGCDYGTQAGYTCMSCNRALHCYFGGAAIMVDCYGLFRFCRDGHCGRHQGDKCFGDNRLTTTATLLNTTSQSESHLQSATPSEGNAQSDQSLNVKPISVGISLANLDASGNLIGTSPNAAKRLNVIHGVDVNLNLPTENAAPVVKYDANE